MGKSFDPFSTTVEVFLPLFRMAKKLHGLFADHPESVGESYFEHMQSAFTFGTRMLGAGLACLAHGIFPFLFVKTGSTTIRHLHDAMISHRSRARAAPEWMDHGAYI